MVTKHLEEYFLTHDLARIILGNTPLPAYLYAYLSSWIGRALLAKDQYGSAIRHIEPHHIADIPVPLLPDADQQIIHERILRACMQRDEAHSLLESADKLLHEELRLPEFDESLVPYMSEPTHNDGVQLVMPRPRAFSVRALQLDGCFDASYHNPTVGAVVRLLHQGKYPVVRMDELTAGVFIPPRFKRIYVSREHGIPFLQGSHLAQVKPYDVKYLSRSSTRNLSQWIIREGWVLVTCSGTIGRVSLVSSMLDRWAASQHLLRIVPEPPKSHPGYVAALLMTPYGREQLKSKVYGGVVDELTEDDVRTLWIPWAPPGVRAAIGGLGRGSI